MQQIPRLMTRKSSIPLRESQTNWRSNLYGHSQDVPLHIKLAGTLGVLECMLPNRRRDFHGNDTLSQGNINTVNEWRLLWASGGCAKNPNQSHKKAVRKWKSNPISHSFLSCRKVLWMFYITSSYMIKSPSLRDWFYGKIFLSFHNAKGIYKAWSPL